MSDINEYCYNLTSTIPKNGSLVRTQSHDQWLNVTSEARNNKRKNLIIRSFLNLEVQYCNVGTLLSGNTLAQLVGKYHCLLLLYSTISIEFPKSCAVWPAHLNLGINKLNNKTEEPKKV